MMSFAWTFEVCGFVGSDHFLTLILTLSRMSFIRYYFLTFAGDVYHSDVAHHLSLDLGISFGRDAFGFVVVTGRR